MYIRLNPQFIVSLAAAAKVNPKLLPLLKDLPPCTELVARKTWNLVEPFFTGMWGELWGFKFGGLGFGALGFAGA